MATGPGPGTATGPSHPLDPLLTHYTPLRVFQDLKRFHVNTLVRVCDATYDKAPVEKEGIQVVVSRPAPRLLSLVPLFFPFTHSLT